MERVNKNFRIDCLLKMKVPYICIDVDKKHLKDLQWIYKKARELFDYDEIELYLSSSREGIHLIIKREVSALEDLFLRAYLEDDPYRLRISLARLYMNPCDEGVDISFSMKGNSHRIKATPIKELLEKFNKGEVDEDYVIEELYKLADEVTLPIPVKRELVIDYIKNDTIQEIIDKLKPKVESFLYEFRQGKEQ